MKKNFKRKNYVLIGAIGIAAVALTSVGFATWITGMQKTEAPADITNIVVDTAENDTLYLDVALEDATISLKQQTVNNGTGKLSAKDNAEGADLTIKFSKFSVYASSKYNPNSIRVTMEVSFDTGAGLQYVNEGIAKTGSSDTYIKLPEALTGETIALTGSDSNIDGYTVKSLATKEMNFWWGSLFGGTDPIAHYNGLIGSKTSPEDVLPIMSLATSTLNEMNQKLNDKTIKLTFKVEADPA